MINVDGFAEIDEIAHAARIAQRKQNVGVRVITSVGWSSQFGLAIASGSAMEAFRTMRKHSHLIPTGLHFHLGTGIRDVAIYLQAVRETLEFAQALRTELGIHITQLDLGGGFGVPTVRPFTEWDTRLTLNSRPAGPVDVAAAARPADYAQGIIELITKYYPADADTSPTVIFEPGRAITSSSQSLVLRVLAVKDDPIRRAQRHPRWRQEHRDAAWLGGSRTPRGQRRCGCARVDLQLLRTPVPPGRSSLSIKDFSHA